MENQNSLFIEQIQRIDDLAQYERINMTAYANYRTDVSEKITELFIKIESNVFVIKEDSSKFRLDVAHLNPPLNRFLIGFEVIRAKRLDTLVTKALKYIFEHQYQLGN